MIFEKTEKDAAFDSELRKIQNRIDQNQRKRAQGEIDTESLLQERQHEQENSLSNHVIIGGSLLVLLSSMILFAMAKSAGMSMYYCLGFSVGTLILGNVPFLAVWMLKNKEFALTALLIIPNVCLLCCTGCTGFPSALDEKLVLWTLCNGRISRSWNRWRIHDVRQRWWWWWSTRDTLWNGLQAQARLFDMLHLSTRNVPGVDAFFVCMHTVPHLVLYQQSTAEEG
jgi:hypothetical protein